MGGQLADLRALDRLEVGLKQLAVEYPDAAARDAVDLVARVPGDVDLGREQLAVSLLHLEVDVRRGPAGVRDRLDRAEAILARRPGGEPAEPLEVLVLVLLGAVAGVEIDLRWRRTARSRPSRCGSGCPIASSTRPVRWVISPTAGVMLSLMMIRSLSVSSGSLSG